jgi:anti-sigma B factor antagonist
MMLQLTTHTLGDAAIVDCAGKIVYGEEVSFLRSYVKDLLSQHHRIVLSLSGVTHIDSNGVGTLVSLWASARSAGGDLKLAALSTRAHDVLMTAKLASLFGAFETVEQAARSFAPSEQAS